jgi:hypothetical protein
MLSPTQNHGHDEGLSDQGHSHGQVKEKEADFLWDKFVIFVKKKPKIKKS